MNELALILTLGLGTVDRETDWFHAGNDIGKAAIGHELYNHRMPDGSDVSIRIMYEHYSCITCDKDKGMNFTMLEYVMRIK